MDCNYIFLIDLAPNKIPFCAKSKGKRLNIIKIWFWLGKFWKVFSVCTVREIVSLIRPVETSYHFILRPDFSFLSYWKGNYCIKNIFLIMNQRNCRLVHNQKEIITTIIFLSIGKECENLFSESVFLGVPAARDVPS